MEIPWQDLLKIIFAFVAGTLLGFEREYKDKPAGLRTIILITVGASLFSMINLTLDSSSHDRIASTVVTGIGFVGAGVIFKQGVNVHGLTTASTIWVAAAIGMAIGFGQYWHAGTTLILTLIALTILGKVEKNLSTKLQLRDLKFSFDKDTYSLDELEQEFKTRSISFIRYRLYKESNELTAEYKLSLSRDKYKEFFDFLMNNSRLKHFEEMV